MNINCFTIMVDRLLIYYNISFDTLFQDNEKHYSSIKEENNIPN